MRKMGRTQVWICFGLVLLIGLLVAGSASAGLFGLFKGKASRSAAAAKASSLVVFPLDQIQQGNIPPTMGEELASALRTGLSGNRKYNAILYKDKLAPIKRAREDSTLKPKEDAGPFSEDRSKALRLARILAVDFFAVGSVEDLQVEASRKSAQITLSMDIVDTNTGKLVRTLLVTGRTPDGSNSASEEDAIALAAGDAVAKLKSQMLEEDKSNAASSAAVPTIAVEKPAPAAPAVGSAGAPKPAAPAAPRSGRPAAPPVPVPAAR